MKGRWRPDATTSTNLLAQAEEWQQSLYATELDAHAWTLAEIREAAKVAASRSVGAQALPRVEAVDIAWEGVALAIAEDPSISFLDAVAGGFGAINAECNALRQLHGSPRSERRREAGGYTPKGEYRVTDETRRERFVVYWRGAMKPVGVPEEIIEYHALHECMDKLAERHRAVLLVRAAHQSDTEAAAALGIHQSGLSRRLRAARAAFWAIWYDHEAPPAPPVMRPLRGQRDECCRKCGASDWGTRGAGRYCRACSAARNARRRSKGDQA